MGLALPISVCCYSEPIRGVTKWNTSLLHERAPSSIYRNCIVEFYEWSVKVSHVLPTWEKSLLFFFFPFFPRLIARIASRIFLLSFYTRVQTRRTFAKNHRWKNKIGGGGKIPGIEEIHFGRWKIVSGKILRSKTIAFPRNEISLSRTIRAARRSIAFFWTTAEGDAVSSFSDVCRLGEQLHPGKILLIRNSPDRSVFRSTDSDTATFFLFQK